MPTLIRYLLSAAGMDALLRLFAETVVVVPGSRGFACRMCFFFRCDATVGASAVPPVGSHVQATFRAKTHLPTSGGVMQFDRHAVSILAQIPTREPYRPFAASLTDRHSTGSVCL
jgi:hypothetical protein